MTLAYRNDLPIRRGDNKPVVKELQLALLDAGHELVADGSFGAITEDAVKLFQAANGLAPDGVVGALTATVLDATPTRLRPPKPMTSVISVAPWLSTMRAISGTKEIPGPQDSPLILGWRDEIGRRYPAMAAYARSYTHDSIAWCGLAVAYAMAVSDVEPVAQFLWADNWRRFGVPLEVPTPGAVMTFSRSGGNHVTLYEGEDDAHYYCRGGNQSDMVNVSARSKAQRPTSIRWPANRPLPTAGRFRTTMSAAVKAGSEA